ncbi:MAG: M20/M25/M40 family metallo-hydrolase [Gemmatimonadetes bacterium]|nr:M20/M25/M40 family metallo-hydrolase [Gemmatimonadota bacterium]
MRALFQALAPAHAALEARAALVLHDQLEVHAIPAPTGLEGTRAAWIADRFRTLGLEHVIVDAAGNVRGERPGERGLAPVVVGAHLDTVFDATTPLAVQRDGLRYVAPGIADNARGLAALVALAAACNGSVVRTRRPLLFVATTGEEGAGDLRGAKALFRELGTHVAAAVMIDGAGDEAIVHRALGARRLRASWQGPGGHSWGAFGAANALHAAAGCATRLAALRLPRDAQAALSVTRMAGGHAINAIPAEAWLEVDIRSTDQGLLDRLVREVERAAQAATDDENARARRDLDGLEVAVTTIGDRPCGELPASDPLVVAAAAATRLTGGVPTLDVASTDASVPIARGIPAITIGAGGRAGAAHTLAEWYDDRGSARGRVRALAIVAAAAGLA